MTDSPESQFQYPPRWAPPEPGVIPLRPLDIGAVFAGSFKSLWRNWPTVLAPFVANAVASVVALPLMLSALAGLPVSRPGQQLDQHFLDQFMRALGTLLTFIGVSWVLTGLAWLLMQAVVTVVVSRAVLGRSTTAAQSLRLAAPRMRPLLGLWLLIWLSIAACTVLPVFALLAIAVTFGVPGLYPLAFLVMLIGFPTGLYLAVRYSVAQTALIMEPQPVLNALRRSSWLVANNGWRVFGTLLLAELIAIGGGWIVQLPVSYATGVGNLSIPDVRGGPTDPAAMLQAVPISLLVLSFVVSALVSAIGQMFVTGVLTLLYHDLRIRKESFHEPLLAMSQLPDELSAPPSAHPESHDLS